MFLIIWCFICKFLQANGDMVLNRGLAAVRAASGDMSVAGDFSLLPVKELRPGPELEPEVITYCNRATAPATLRTRL